MTSLSLAVGQIIELNDGRQAIIRFLGPTGFAPGEWIGVELDEPSGKNDGSVKGDRYFDCDANYGMFLRSAGVGKIVEQPRTRAASKSQTDGPATGRPRPSSISSHVGAAKRESMAANSALRTPARSPTKQLGTVSKAAARTSTPPTAAGRRPATATTTKSRASLAATPSLTHKRTSTLNAAPAASLTSRATSRPSITGQAPTSRAPARSAPGRQALAPPKVPNSYLSSVTSNTSDDFDTPSGHPSPLPSPAHEDAAPQYPNSATEQAKDDEQDNDTSSYAPAQPPPSSMRPPPRRASSPHAPSASQRTTRSAAVPSRELEDLQAKMRILERKRLEDRERLKKMGELEQERDKYASVMQKLQTKLQTQSQELVELRKQLKESEASLLDIEAIQAEHDSVVEIATLDREMAEETAEVLKTEVEALRSKNEEMGLELEILREESSELGREMNPEERTSQGWLQMERSNERLREALLRLRDITQEQEAELKDQVSALEEEVKDYSSIKTNYEDIKEKLLGTQADLDDLRQQLEAALGAEDMIEELTERNMSLQEDMEELRATIEDLESLKELNDELEINHVEAEKQMQEEIDFKDALVNENIRRTTQQAQTIEDCEYTISRFRDLVTNLQADLEDMRASQQLTDKEAEDLSYKSRAMMNLNMKLQISASKTQIKTIDLELRRLEAEEASEHLSIVQLFLPEAFQAERDSVLALLRFKRIGFKANLVHGFVKERIGAQSINLADSNLFAACSVVDRLTWISSMGERFVNSICGCSVEDFARYEGALYELEPVERALNSYIEALKRNDLNEKRVDEELQRSMAVMSHLASLHIRTCSAAFADDVLMQTSLIQSHLESTASALSLCRSLVQTNVPGLDDEEEDESTEPTLMEKLDAFISNARSAKVVTGKTHRALSELQSRSLALESSKMDVFLAAEHASAKLAAFARNAGEALQILFGEEGREQPYSVSEINLTVSRVTTNTFELPLPDTSTLATVATKLRALTHQLNDLGTLPNDLEKTIEFERSLAPWVVRSTELRKTKLTSVDTEAEVARLTETVRERSLLVRTKEQELEEQGVRIEMLEARMAEAQKRSAQLGELEASIQASKQAETNLEAQLSEASRDLQRLRRERDELRERISEQQASTKGVNAPNVDIGGGASRIELDRARAQEKNLNAAIRYLQRSSSATSDETALDVDWLKQPLFVEPTPEQRQFGSLQAEAKSAISELLTVVTKSRPTNLSLQYSKNRLAWRPAQETTSWATNKKREEWETWRDWQDDLLTRARAAEKSSIRFNRPPTKHRMDDYRAVDGIVVVGEDQVHM